MSAGARDRPTVEHVRRVRDDADLIFGTAEIEQALDRMAAAITARIGDRDPLLLGAMLGGVVPLGVLLPRLSFPLQIDYVHATRYLGRTSGGELHWLRKPGASLRDRTVLLIDDVLDKGVTLAAIVEACREAGAREVLTAVLVRKRVAARPGLQDADFAALDADDRYLFGWGMDYRSYLRNGDGVYAVADRDI
ncbi:MAG: hypoxanthine-guanine phosphoribosyltransferase [Chromatiales bacterium]